MTPHERLRALLAESGLSQVKFAEAIGRDPRSMRRWLAGEPMPDNLTVWLARVQRITVTAQKITLVLERE